MKEVASSRVLHPVASRIYWGLNVRREVEDTTGAFIFLVGSIMYRWLIWSSSQQLIISKKTRKFYNWDASDGDACCSVAQEIAEELMWRKSSRAEGEEGETVQTHQSIRLVKAQEILATIYGISIGDMVTRTRRGRVQFPKFVVVEERCCEISNLGLEKFEHRNR